MLYEDSVNMVSRPVGSLRYIGCAFAIILELQDTWQHFPIITSFISTCSRQRNTCYFGECPFSDSEHSELSPSYCSSFLLRIIDT